MTLDQRTSLFSSLSERDLAELEYEWQFWARPNQLPPALSQSGGPWTHWLLLAGRGFGKSRTGAEWIRAEVESGRRKRLALIAPTAADARDVMVEGESGILACCPDWNRPRWEPSKRRLTWPNGAIATTYSADEPERLRGPQHDGAWCDEICSWRYPETHDMLMFGLRLGEHPQVVATTTPKPIKLVRKLLADPTTAITRGNTYENAANLAPTFIHALRQTYEGTRLGRQEIYAEVLEDVAGALWNRAMLDEHRWPKNTPIPVMKRIVVAIDPAMSSEDGSDETGIVVCGLAPDNRAFVLEDLSGKFSPDQWARKAVQAYHRWKADKIVGETNQGGEMVGNTIRQIDNAVPFKSVKASKGKFTRAEPVAALYEQGRVSHANVFEKLEDQMCVFTTDIDRASYGSPDRVDALVWALHELVVENQLTGLLDWYGKQYEQLQAEREGRTLDRLAAAAEDIR